MKKTILTIGLFSLVMVLTSFTTNEKVTTTDIASKSMLDLSGNLSTGGNKKVDLSGNLSTGGNKKVDLSGNLSTGGNKKVD